MKKTKALFTGAFLCLLLSAAAFIDWQIRSKSSTSIIITSISPESPRVGDVVQFKAQVTSHVSDFTIIALPDTQHYADAHPEIFLSQTQWIAENKEDLNIVFVTHLGDIVQNGDQNPDEWIVADQAMSLLDGNVPYGVLPGNHDMEPGGQAAYYQYYFPASRFEDQEWWGGSFNHNKNNFQLFSAGGDDYLILHLQYCPTKEAIDWADGIVRAFPERKAILSTHAYLLNETTRLSHCQDRSDGDVAPTQMWRRFIKEHTNIFLVLCGHIPGVARRTDPQGRLVHQILVDFQDLDNGGSGFLRIMTFQPSHDRILSTTYSPYLDVYLEDDANQFELPFEMTGGSLPTGEITIGNGTDKCVTSIKDGSCELVLTIQGENEFQATYAGDSENKFSTSPGLSIYVEGK